MKPLALAERLIGAAAFVMFAAMLLLTLSQVLFRYFLQIPVPWTEEVARALFVLATMSGIALAYPRRDHIIVDFLFVKAPPALQRALSIGFALVILLFLVLWARGAWEMALRNWDVTLITVSWFRAAFFYYWELAMIALLGIYVLLDLAALLRGNLTGLQTADGTSEQEIDL